MKKIRVNFNEHSALVSLDMFSATIKAEGHEIYLKPGHENCYDTADGRTMQFYEPTYIEGEENAPQWLQDIVATIDVAMYERKTGMLYKNK